MSEPAIWTIPPGFNRPVLIVVAHADDPALFLGGTISIWTKQNWRVVCVRATDDRTDSVGLSYDETIRRNKAEFEAAMRVLGVSETVELNYQTDTLGDASELELREKIIRLIRQHKPYSLVTFDPHSKYAEDNCDHLVLATAVDEAFWTAQFGLHHPEHIREGLEVHGMFERVYFGRSVGTVTDVVDITSTLDVKVEASCEHRTMLTNYANQLILQARTGGWDLPIAQSVIDTGDVRPLMEPLLRAGAARTGEKYGVGAVEEFRVVRYGRLQVLLDRCGIKREDAGWLVEPAV